MASVAAHADHEPPGENLRAVVNAESYERRPGLARPPDVVGPARSKAPLPSLVIGVAGGGLRKASEPLSLPLTLSGATSLPFAALRGQEAPLAAIAPNRRSSCKEMHETANRMERVKGVEPSTFSLGTRSFSQGIAARKSLGRRKVRRRRGNCKRSLAMTVGPRWKGYDEADRG